MQDKGERCNEITWIGVTIKIRWEDKLVFLEVPAKMIQEIVSELENILEASMVGVRRLRSIADRLSWISGVVPRLRWAVCMVYAVVTAVDRDVAEGIEEQRAGWTPGTKRLWWRPSAAPLRCAGCPPSCCTSLGAFPARSAFAQLR